MPISYHHIASSSTDEHSVTREPALPGNVRFLDGVTIRTALPDPLVVEVDYATREEVPHFVGMTIPIFSARLVETFRAAGVENFQLFPAVIRNPALAQAWDGYWAFNAIGLIAAADLEQSRAQTVREATKGGAAAVYAFDELVLDGRKTRNEAMFRLAESPSILLVHDRVLEHIKQHRPENGWGFEATGIETV